MTQISRDTVLKLAALSSLQLSDDEVTTMQTDLEHILEYVEQLNDLDTSGVEPAYQVTGLQNVTRSDTVEESIAPESLVALAAESKDGQIKVPKVL